jgi:hypothetical protein
MTEPFWAGMMGLYWAGGNEGTSLGSPVMRILIFFFSGWNSHGHAPAGFLLGETKNPQEILNRVQDDGTFLGWDDGTLLGRGE